MIGAIIGDVIGSRFEWNNLLSKEFELFTPDCRCTDDSILSIAVAKALLESAPPLDIIQQQLIPALDRVGEQFEQGRLFLPQLMNAAETAQCAFEVLQEAIAKTGQQKLSGGKIVVATVEGDIHDIGKNIVKTVMENYGYEMIDLGRDVPPETIVQAVQEQGIRLVGLSALMTTTLPAMEETVRQLKALNDPPYIMVGGAVVTEEYAARMGADAYARDARAAVEIARRLLGGN